MILTRTHRKCPQYWYCNRADCTAGLTGSADQAETEAVAHVETTGHEVRVAKGQELILRGSTPIGLLLEEAVELTDMAAGLNDRTIPWQQWNDELTCWDRQEVAAEEAACAARDAWEAVEAAKKNAERGVAA